VCSRPNVHQLGAIGLGGGTVTATTLSQDDVTITYVANSDHARS
jgi:hypothetical protein